jgi:hypothetical protein
MKFKYSAQVNWGYLAERQQDWIDTISSIEAWLEQYVGVKNEKWAWDDEPRPTFHCIRFKYGKHLTLFLLAYG